MLRAYTLLCSSIALIIISQLYSCQPEIKPPSTGKALAAMYCAGCHMTPEPGLLDKKTWKINVLPVMAVKLGISVWQGHIYYKDLRKKKGISISMDEWTRIEKYYTESAPAQLKPASASPLSIDWAGFKLHTAPETRAESATTLVIYDSLSHTIFSSDALARTFNQWSTDLKLVSSTPIRSAVVNALFTCKKSNNKSVEQILLTSIGSLRPSDKDNGKIEKFMLTGKPLEKGSMIIDHLYRPVQTVSADFNKDGLMDYVSCGFGHRLGGLDLLTQAKDGSFSQSPIRNVPGAEQAVVEDFNHDGWPDLMVLFAQADEGIWMFLNDQHGGFTTRNILRFPPVWGSSSFQLVDFFHTGKPDILYTCGDNADNSNILKPYHGIYIYKNLGDYTFEKSWFYPVNGCTKAIAADFNHTGQLDIASIAFFPDFRNKPQESCIYFRQDRPMQFSAHAIPVSGSGRWLCMTVADYDHDGDLDILLGSFTIPMMAATSEITARATKTPFILLENTAVHSLVKR